MKDNTERSPSLPDESAYPPQLTADYELLECFSASHDLETLLARARAGGELYVVKCYRAGHPLFDRREPEAMKRLDAPPMPRFAAEYKNETMRCVLRQYVPGETLAERAARQPLSVREIIAVGVQLCDQLCALHGAQPPIIHRDIKPQNVIMRADGAAVLIDFGISRVLSEGGTDTFAFGTQGFAPPEQYGYAQTDCRSDIYSLGVLLHWLLRGRAAPLKDPKTALERVVARCTAFDPKHRYADAARLRRALLRAEPRRNRRRRLGFGLAAALLVAALAWGIAAAARSAGQGVTFAQPLIAQAVRRSLGLSDTARITRDMLPKVTGVYIVADDAYADAEGFYSAVSRWYADGRAARGAIDTLDDLAMLPNLEQACVAAQELRDISGLAGLKQLNKVEFKHNYIADISALAGMERLTSVGLNDNPVRDLTPLLRCPGLAFLDLCDVRSYDPGVIAELGNFDYLDLSNPTESYRYLTGKSVLSLRLSWTGLQSLDDLSRVTRLEDLDISHTDVRDLSLLAVHAGLKTVNLAGLPADDLSVLLSLPQLRRVVLSRDMEKLAEQIKDAPFEIQYE